MTTIAHILAEKGRSVSATQPHRTISEALGLLAAKNIGALVVADGDGGLIGILSERDIVRAIGRDGAVVLDDPVSKHMTTRVVTADESECVVLVMEKMTTRRFRHLPVLKDGRLVGLVSIGDIVKFRLEEMQQEHEALKEYIATA